MTLPQQIQMRPFLHKNLLELHRIIPPGLRRFDLESGTASSSSKEESPKKGTRCFTLKTSEVRTWLGRLKR
uniref:Uncharacterized protein n=1 Tax=Tanacetum cinerariifolium TaxID=118510 RepID=A0A699X6E6_TANCI|nr:hypothetical protein [Tanacetum cinerariifolium]